jgi:hypothetical protein
MAGGFYSFRVYAPHEVIIQENFVAIDEGMNTFNCHVNDIDVFVARLKDEGVRIDVMIWLDEPQKPDEENDPPLLPPHVRMP